MRQDDERWDLLILDGGSRRGVVGDLDGDGNQEIISGERWYRPATLESGPIPGGIRAGGVGVTVGDVDGDGRLEVVGGFVTDHPNEVYTMCWCKPGKDLSAPWAEHIISTRQVGHPHDQFVVDIDGDGRNEVVVVGMYVPKPSICIYKPGPDVTQEWRQHFVQVGTSGDGTVVADLDGDGRLEIAAGPYLYTSPPAGALSGPWLRTDLAPGLREMGKAAWLDITANGRPDIIYAESEYPDCRISWFENRMVEDPENPWVEHPLDAGFNFLHSLDAWRGPQGQLVIFLAEMNKGGWDAPYNHDARLVLYTSRDHGATWSKEVISQGHGTFQATSCDIDGDGEREIVGGPGIQGRGLHIWKKRARPSFAVRYRHRFLDRQKPWTGTDILAVDVDGDGRQDVACAGFWYRNPTWERRQIPGAYQVINAYDIDGDGRDELIVTRKKPGSADPEYYHNPPRDRYMYELLTSDMWWLKPIDPLNGEWEEHYIGTATPGQGGHGWPHGTCIAPVLPGGSLAFIARGSGPLELYQVPEDPRQSPWPRRVFVEAEGCASRMIAADLTGNGLPDLVAGAKWLENLGDGTFRAHEIVPAFDESAHPDGLRGGEHLVADVNGDGLLDVIACEEHTNWRAEPQHVSFARLVWLENPGDPREGPWRMHVIDSIRSPHSLAVADLDGDGELEIVCGEHDPFRPYRSRCKVYVYKKANPQGAAWTRHVLDDRFDNHVGTRLIELAPGRIGIISHGWREPSYVHLWEPE
mgnify:CR=1 FL=1